MSIMMDKTDNKSDMYFKHKHSNDHKNFSQMKYTR